MNLYDRLSLSPVSASAPCRVDLGGTLDIGVFFLALADKGPATFNLALDLRTRVELLPHTPGKIKVSSRGFEPAEFHRGQAPFDHPMGLIFAVAQYFDVHGVHIRITSASPPRSALGGSSSAEAAVIGAIMHACGKTGSPQAVVHLAQAIESAAAGVVCGVQDHAAAVFGKAHLWEWAMGPQGLVWKKTPLFDTLEDWQGFQDHFLAAYCGVPHVSVQVNQIWVQDFIKGRNRGEFARIADLSHKFFAALSRKEYAQAARHMNEETRIRLDMTPDVLDNTGKKLFASAADNGCGARFTGAGGGGCLWAVGEKKALTETARVWQEILEPVETAQLLDVRPDMAGLVVDP